MDFVALDFETANAQRSSICAVGVAVVRGGDIAETREWLVRPHPGWFNGMNVAIHGITERDVESACRFHIVWRELAPVLAGLPVVAHNASFDMSALRAALDAFNIQYPALTYFCTMVLGRRAWPEEDRHTLDHLAKRQAISFAHHDACDDAVACAKLALVAAQEARASSLEDLAAHYGVRAGALYPGGYKPCSASRRRR